ncbi:MAG: type II secretion system protein GspD, partial [Pseudomonadota bacterium]|nr:type II secretion system protein GspD [Pseudomonadota bacterium]
MKYRVLVAALVLACSAPALAQYTINMRDADVRAFADDAARVTGLTLVVDGRVNQKVSVVTKRPLSRSEYFEVFLSTLRANGLVAIPISGGYRIQPLEGAATQASRVTSSSRSRNQFVTEIVRLRSIEATGALETVRPLVSQQGSVTANKNANSLVIADFADNVARIRELLRRIDSNVQVDATRTELVYLRNTGPREIATSLQALAGGGAQGGA